MNAPIRRCPDCESVPQAGYWTRRELLQKAAGAAAMAASAPLAAALMPSARAGGASADASREPEPLVKMLYESLTEAQRKKVCFPWDYQHPEWGLLRTRISNNWHITEPVIGSDFFSKDQQELIRAIFEGIFQPEWHARIDQQLKDDAGGYGRSQSIALFGTPGEGPFQFVMTGRHMTIRCDGNSAEHVAFGGPIFYGHAGSCPDNFHEGPNHEGNVFWHQALEANKLYEMLDGRQRKLALVERLPEESAVGFRRERPGIPVTEMTADQKSRLQEVLRLLLEPYRQSDRDEATACLHRQGGLDACSLAFYSEGDIGANQVWDCWRLEGPAFVWYFRGSPHVHVWVNVADDPSVPLNS